MNELNNSFLLGFYSAYAVACVALAAVVLQSLRAMLRSIDSQKLLLEETGSEDESRQLSRINDIADHKAKKVRVIIRKVTLNCGVVVLAALFSLWIDSCSVIGGMQGSVPPPPCPRGAGPCDECEQCSAAAVSVLCVLSA
jgi:hypothetical protein